MSIIRTKRNHIAAIAPLPTDIAVFSRIGTARAIRPINEYNQAVSEAVRLADLMEAHVDVVPVDFDELLALGHMTPETFMESLSPAEWEELREMGIAACIDAIRYSDDPKLVAEATAALANLQDYH